MNFKALTARDLLGEGEERCHEGGSLIPGDHGKSLVYTEDRVSAVASLRPFDCPKDEREIGGEAGD